MEKFPSPYDLISKDSYNTDKPPVVIDGDLSRHKLELEQEADIIDGHSYFGVELRKAKNFLEANDREILQEINQLVSEDMYELSKETAKEYVKTRFDGLSNRGKLFLLEQAINYLSDDEGYFDDMTDMLFVSKSVLDIATKDTANFFVSNFARSFIEESDFKDSIQNSPREYIESIWSNFVHKIGEETVFIGSYQKFHLSRLVNSVTELTDDEVSEIVKIINSEHEIEGYEKISNSYEWVARNENKEFSKSYVSQTVLSDPTLKICNLASDINGVYDSLSGRLVEYLPNQSIVTSEDYKFDLYQFKEDYLKVVNLMDDIGPNLEYQGQILSDIPETIKAVLPDNLNKEISNFLEFCASLRENTKYDTDEYGRILMQDKEMLQQVEDTAMSIKVSVKNVVEKFLIDKQILKDSLAISDIVGGKKEVDENRLQYIYELFASKRMRQHMEKYFGFKYEELTLKTQIMFINYVLDKDNNEVDKVQNFISSTTTEKEKVNRFRTFLSLERGDQSLGDDIVEFGQNFAEADKIFSYYGELLDSADNAENLVKERVDCDNVECSGLIEQVRENILNRAQKDLEKAVRTNDLENLEQNMEFYIAEAKEYVALLQEIGKSNIEKISASALSETDKNAMIQLLKKNYEIISPGEDQVDFREAVLNSLINSFDNPNTEFRILRDKDKIVSFNRFDTVVNNDGSEITYFGSFNADPAYSGVGGVVLEETIKDRLKDGRPMLAHTDPNQPITKKYINSGFVMTNIEQNYAGTGRMIFEIWQSSEINNQLESKQLTEQELLDKINDESSDIIIREQTPNETYPEINAGKALTRYIKNEGKTYLVFEKLPKPLNKESDIDIVEQKEAA